MQIFFDFFQKYLLSRRSGSVVRTMAMLCWVATLIGVAALIVVLSIMNGFNESIHKKLLGLDPHLIISLSQSDKKDLKADRILDIVADVVPEHESLEFVSRQDAIMRTLDGAFSGIDIRGHSKAGLFAVQERLLSSVMAVELDVREVLIGAGLARQLGLFEGDEVLLIAPESLILPQGEIPRYERMRIKSIFVTDMEDIDSKVVLFQEQDSLFRFQSSNSRVATVELRLQKAQQAEHYKSLLIRALKKAGYTVGGQQQSQSSVGLVHVETWFDRNAAMFQALRLEKIAMSTFLSLAIFITSFSLISVVTMLISQKKKEIGLLLAIGMPAKKVMRLFLSLGMMLSGLGLVFGLLFGTAVSLYIQFFPPAIMPEIYVDRALPSRLDFTSILYIAIFIAVIAFLSAYLPVRSYISKSPADNLRSS